MTSKRVFHNQWVTIIEKKIKAGNGSVLDYYIVKGSKVVCALGITENNKIILVKQYRPAIQKVTIDLPGGAVNVNELPSDAIVREFEEETGYRLVKPKRLAEFYYDSGRSNKKSVIYYGKVTGPTETRQDANEEIEILKLSFEEVRQLIMSRNFIVEPSLQLAYFSFLMKQPKLSV